MAADNDSSGNTADGNGTAVSGAVTGNGTSLSAAVTSGSNNSGNSNLGTVGHSRQV